MSRSVASAVFGRGGGGVRAGVRNRRRRKLIAFALALALGAPAFARELRRVAPTLPGRQCALCGLTAARAQLREVGRNLAIHFAIRAVQVLALGLAERLRTPFFLR